MIKKTIISCLLLCSGLAIAQSEDLQRGFHLYDRFGDLVEPQAPSTAPASPPTPDCTPDFFELYYVNEPGFDPITSAEQAIICQVFEDISALITPQGSPTVKIEVRNTAVAPALGTATSYYSGYYDGSTSYAPEIYDGMVWEYINTGVNPFDAAEGTGLMTENLITTEDLK